MIIDWSQFIPGLIINIIGVILTAIFAGLIAYHSSNRFKVWINHLSPKFIKPIRLIVSKWHFLLPFLFVIALMAITFRIYQDLKFIGLSFIFYLLGLLGWGLSYKKQSTSKVDTRNESMTTHFLPIALPADIGNSYLKNRYINPPIGKVTLGEAEYLFNPDSLVFDTYEQIRYYLPLSNNGKEVELQLPKSINGVQAVYVLINSSNSKTIYLNKSIGKIKLFFNDAPPIVVELILGKNIREWCPGNPGEFVRETSSTESVTCVWTGISKNGANAVIDCLKIPVFKIMKVNHLEKISFIHQCDPQPTDSMGVHYSVFGISIELQQVK